MTREEMKDYAVPAKDGAAETEAAPRPETPDAPLSDGGDAEHKVRQELIALAEKHGMSLDELLEMQAAQRLHSDPAPEPPEAPEEAVDPDDPLPNGSYFEHKARQEAREREKHRRNFPYPIAVTIAYLVLGFVFHMWHPGWIIFLTIPLFYLPASERTSIRLLGNPVMVTIIYLLLGTICNLWHPGWLVFLLIPLLGSRGR